MDDLRASEDADAKMANVTDETKQGQKATESTQGRFFIYPAEFDAENEEEYVKFQLWCQEDGRDGSWPPAENTSIKDERKNQIDDESDGESDDDSSDDDDDWLPEQYQVASDPIPTEATLRRPIAYLLFSQGERMADYFVKGLSFLKKTAKPSPLQEAVMKNIQENRKIPRMVLLLDKTSFILRVSVLQSSVPVFRDIRVPSNINLRMLQTRVLCPIFAWDAKVTPQKYIYYLPHTCYPSQRRPLSRFKDIVFTRPFQDDFFDQLYSNVATEAQVIDDSDVCLADFLQEVGHTLYYQHNISNPITLQLQVLELHHDKSVDLIAGVGISPPESGLITEGPFDQDQEIVGIDAFNLAIKWLQSASIHKSYKDEGKRLLEIEDSDKFDPTIFDLPGVRKMLQRSLRHSTPRTHVPIEARRLAPMLMFGLSKPVHLPVVKSLGMCKTCLKENVKLLHCGRCKSVFYCSKDCQKKDWKSHRAVCTAPC